MILSLINLVKRKRTLICTLFLLTFFIFGQFALAGDYGLINTAEEAFGKDSGDIPFKDASLAEIIGKVVGAALAFIGIVFFILIIYGGFLWMTARGNEQQVTKAKDLIIAASIGLVIVLAAYAITYYIGNVLGQTQE